MSAVSKKSLNKEKTRAKILSHALSLFSKHGYQGATIRMLAKEAGISLGLSYNYFKSKEELLKQLIEEGIRNKLEQVKTAHVPAQGLDSLVDAVFMSIQKDPVFWRLMQSIKMQLDVMTMVEQEMSPYSKWLTDQVETYTKLQKKNMDHRLILAAIDGVADHYLMDTAGYPLQSVLKELKQTLGISISSKSSASRKSRPKKNRKEDDSPQTSLF